MTNEDIRILKVAIENSKEHISFCFDLRGIEALNHAIKALEQESVLDKIRAKIENHCGLAKENHCRYCSYCNNLMGVREILEIIDEYKAESEEV